MTNALKVCFNSYLSHFENLIFRWIKHKKLPLVHCYRYRIFPITRGVYINIRIIHHRCYWLTDLVARLLQVASNALSVLVTSVRKVHVQSVV